MSSRHSGARASAFALLAATASLALPSCAKVLGVDEADYADAVAEICSCPVGEAAAGGDCVARVTSRLDAAGPQTSAAWLQAYADKGCTTCDLAAPCFYSAPVCATGECVESEECCGFANKAERCAKPAGQSTGTCVACTKFGDSCTSETECCGATGKATCAGLSAGAAKGFCVETCEASLPDDCPGCCQRVLGNGISKKTDLCAEQVSAIKCAPHCNGPDDVTSCPLGTRCTSLLDVVGLAKVVKATVYGCK